MYSIIKTVIASGRYELADIIAKIDTVWVQGDLTDNQKTELVTLAQTNAQPENSYAPLQEQINAAFEKIDVLQKTIESNATGMAALKDAVEKLGQSVTIPDPKPADEYPDWYAWDGIGLIPWQNGSTCTHNGNKWKSGVDNNVWEPGATGVGENIWQKIIG